MFSEFAAFAELAPDGQGCYRTFCATRVTSHTTGNFQRVFRISLRKKFPT